MSNSWDCIAPVKDHMYTIQQNEHDSSTVIQQRRTVSKGMDISRDDDDTSRKTVDVIQLPLTF